MESNEKTFRYSQIKSLGILYLMFLVLCVVGGLFVGIREFMFFAILIGLGVILLVLFLTSSVTISDMGITAKNLLGKKSIQWSEIRHVSSQGASIKLHSRDGSNALSLSPRLENSVEIFDLIYSRRPDLFSLKKNNLFVRSFRNNLITLAIGLLLIVVSFVLYFNIRYLDIFGGIVGLLFCAQALFSWYFSPRRITMQNDCLIVNYLNKSVSHSADDIADIQIGRTKQNQFKSVDIVFRGKRTVLPVSEFKQSPFIIYPVLHKWHQIYAQKQPAQYL
jgi:hypothetical protein